LQKLLDPALVWYAVNLTGFESVGKGAMKQAFFVLLLSYQLFATRTTISQVVRGPDGFPASGTAVISISAACRSGTDYIVDRAPAVVFKGGAFSVSLVATDSCALSGGSGFPWFSTATYVYGDRVTYSGGVYVAVVGSVGVVPSGNTSTWSLISPSYSVQWTLSDGTAWSEVWLVQTSATPLSIDSVKVSQVNLPSVPVPGPAGAGAAPSGTANQVLATPNGSSGTSSLRALVPADIPALNYQAPITGAPSTWPTTSYAFSFSATTYNTGTVDVTNGSNAIVGHGTTWTSEMTGRLFIPRLANCNRGYVFTYVSDTSGTLESTYGTGSDSGHLCPDASGTEYQLSDVISVPASTHLLGTADISIQCFDSNTPRNRLDGFLFAAGPSVDPTTYAVSMVFWSTQAGRCILQR
jgi:hypothetical protein